MQFGTIWDMRLWIGLASMSLGMFLSIGVRLAGAAMTCPQCEAITAQIGLQEAYKRQMTDLVAKNREALAKLDKGETSRRIKINSNILVASLNNEAAQNQIASLVRDMGTPECKACAVKTVGDPKRAK